MAIKTPSGRRALLYLAAALFGATTALYSVIWMYYAEQAGSTKIGAEFTYSVRPHFLRVTRVRQGSNAQEAGLRPGDEILAINYAELDTLTPYYELAARGRPGDTVKFLVLRPGEDSPRIVSLVLESPVPLELYRLLTPSRIIALQIARSYPMLFLVVGLAVLLLKVEDSNAWLLALFFAGFIAVPDLPPGALPSSVRGFVMVFHVVLSLLAPAILYFFLATFPGPSPLERRAPWLKWALLIVGGIYMVVGLWTIALVRAYDSFWLPLEYAGPAWLGSSIRAAGHSYEFGGELLAVASLTANSFRAVTPEAQRKARVIVWGMVCGLLPMILLFTALLLTGRRFQETPFWLYVFCVFCLFLLPLSFAYAVVKHRVLEIPVLLKRSARYFLVRRGFAVLTFASSFGLAWLFIAVSPRFFHPRPEAAMPLGLIVGMAFLFVLTKAHSRVDRRIIQGIDRAFFRNAYDARVILEELGERVRAAKDRQSLSEMLEQQIVSALHPLSLAIYLETKTGRLAVHTASSPPGLDMISSDAPVLAELARRGKPWEVPGDLGGDGGSLSALQAANTQCLVPLLGREGRLIGVIGLGPQLSEEAYSGEDMRLLASVAGQAGIALESLELAEQMAEKFEAERRAAQEMEFARQVQARLFPQKLPPLKTLEYAGACIQARQVGGDYYDFLELRPGRLALVLADIAGKGVSGALLMANLQANLRSQYAIALDDLPRLLNSVNQLFYENTTDSSYATLFFGDYDDSTRRLRYANCGHLPPLLLRAGDNSPDQPPEARKVELLRPTCTVVGLFQQWQCEIAEVGLAPGDTLVLYTDGVTEAESAGGEEFGEARLIQTLWTQHHLSAPLLLEAIVAAVRDFSQGQQADDITLVVARCGS
jgi:phosphoserine phosphatase RsbU/P